MFFRAVLAILTCVVTQGKVTPGIAQLSVIQPIHETYKIASVECLGEDSSVKKTSLMVRRFLKDDEAFGDPINPNPEPLTKEECDTIADLYPKWFFYVFGTFLIVFGLLFGFLGWRMFQVMVFLSAFGIGFSIGFFGFIYIFDAVGVTDEWAFWTSLAIGLVLGTMLWCCVMQMMKFALFVCGAFAGVMFGSFISKLIDAYIANYPDWGVWTCCIIFGFCGGFAGIFAGKLFVMLGTAWVGAVLFSNGAGVFALANKAHPNGDTSWTCGDGATTGTEFWIYFGVTIVMFLLGFGTQWKFFWEHDPEAKK